MRQSRFEHDTYKNLDRRLELPDVITVVTVAGSLLWRTTIDSSLYVSVADGRKTTREWGRYRTKWRREGRSDLLRGCVVRV